MDLSDVTTGSVPRACVKGASGSGLAVEGFEADGEFWRAAGFLLDAFPDDPDDVEVAEEHDDRGQHEDVDREEGEVDLALPRRRVPLTPAQMLRGSVCFPA